MTQANPRAGDVFVDKDWRSEGRKVTVLHVVNPQGEDVEPYAVVSSGTHRTVTILLRRLQTERKYAFLENRRPVA